MPAHAGGRGQLPHLDGRFTRKAWPVSGPPHFGGLTIVHPAAKGEAKGNRRKSDQKRQKSDKMVTKR